MRDMRLGTVLARWFSCGRVDALSPGQNQINLKGQPGSSPSCTTPSRVQPAGANPTSPSQRNSAWGDTDSSIGRLKARSLSHVDSSGTATTTGVSSELKQLMAAPFASPDLSVRARSGASMLATPAKAHGAAQQSKREEGKLALETLVRCMADAEASVRGGNLALGISPAGPAAGGGSVRALHHSSSTPDFSHEALPHTLRRHATSSCSMPEAARAPGPAAAPHSAGHTHVSLLSSKSSPLARIDLGTSHGSHVQGVKVRMGGGGGHSKATSHRFGDGAAGDTFLDTIFQATAEASVRGGKRYYNPDVATGAVGDASTRGGRKLLSPDHTAGEGSVRGGKRFFNPDHQGAGDASVRGGRRLYEQLAAAAPQDAPEGTVRGGKRFLNLDDTVVGEGSAHGGKRYYNPGQAAADGSIRGGRRNNPDTAAPAADTGARGEASVRGGKRFHDQSASGSLLAAGERSARGGRRFFG